MGKKTGIKREIIIYEKRKAILYKKLIRPRSHN